MLRTTLASSRVLRACALGLVTGAIVFSSSTAEARHRHRHDVARHHEERDSYSPQFSSIIVDANSGATLESNSPDGIRHPASLTKVMTLYLLFERLESGKMTLDTEMPVSEHASDQDPTKLGLRPGSTLRVEDAIKGVVTKSANDAAVVIAEAIGGDESDFAKMMTRKARAIRQPLAAPSRIAFRAIIAISPRKLSTSTATPSTAITIFWAASRASTASRPAIFALPASTSSPIYAAAIDISSVW